MFQENQIYLIYIFCILVCLFFIFVYLEIFELNFCGLSRMIKKNIELRGQTEQKISINVNNDEEEKGSILSKEGYMIELGRTPSSELNFSDVDSLDSTHPSS